MKRTFKVWAIMDRTRLVGVCTKEDNAVAREIELRGHERLEDATLTLSPARKPKRASR